MAERLKTAVAAEPACLCGHSKEAHQFVSKGNCPFCACQKFNLHSVSGEVPPVVAPLSGLASHAGYLLVRDIADRLGIAAARLGSTAEKRVVADVNVARLWAARHDEVRLTDARYASRTASQRAQAASFRDLAAHLRHHGRVVSGAVIRDQAAVSPARWAETQAIDRQIDPTTSDHGPLPAQGDGHSDARASERVGLENVLRRAVRRRRNRCT